MRIGIAPATDKHRRVRHVPDAKPAKPPVADWRLAGRRAVVARCRLVQPTSAASLPTTSRTFADSSACSRGRLAFQGLERHGQFDRVDHARTGDPERLAGLVVRPHPAVLAEGPADDRQRLALQRAVAERARQPVDRVLDHRRECCRCTRGSPPGRHPRRPPRPAAPPPAQAHARRLRSSHRRFPRCRTAGPPAPRTR